MKWPICTIAHGLYGAANRNSREAAERISLPRPVLEHVFAGTPNVHNASWFTLKWKFQRRQVVCQTKSHAKPSSKDNVPG